MAGLWAINLIQFMKKLENLLVYKDGTNFSFDELLKKDKWISIHQRNLQILTTEIYKMKNDLGPDIMIDIFHFVEKPHWEMIQFFKIKETAQFTLERKVYIFVPPKYGK